MEEDMYYTPRSDRRACKYHSSTVIAAASAYVQGVRGHRGIGNGGIRFVQSPVQLKKMKLGHRSLVALLAPLVVLLVEVLS